LYLK